MSHGLPTAEIICRTVHIRFEGCPASGWLHPVDGLFWLVTAAHVLPNVHHGKAVNIEVSMAGKWHSMTGIPFFDEACDVAVLKTFLTVNDQLPPYPLCSVGMTMGQDCYFLGFPDHEHIEHLPRPENGGLPIPFVKKAFVSAVQSNLIFLDGHNIPGFSGGPVTFWCSQQNRYQIAGVVSHYFNQVDETFAGPDQQPHAYGQNAGIAAATMSERVSTLITRNC